MSRLPRARALALASLTAFALTASPALTGPAAAKDKVKSTKTTDHGSGRKAH
jgi:hypothetical protein